MMNPEGTQAGDGPPIAKPSASAATPSVAPSGGLRIGKAQDTGPRSPRNISHQINLSKTLWGFWAWKPFLFPASQLQFPWPSLSSRGQIQELLTWDTSLSKLWDMGEDRKACMLQSMGLKMSDRTWTKTREVPPGNNGTALGHSPGSTMRDAHRNVFKLRGQHFSHQRMTSWGNTKGSREAHQDYLRPN